MKHRFRVVALGIDLFFEKRARLEKTRGFCSCGAHDWTGNGRPQVRSVKNGNHWRNPRKTGRKHSEIASSGIAIRVSSETVKSEKLKSDGGPRNTLNTRKTGLAERWGKIRRVPARRDKSPGGSALETSRNCEVKSAN